MGCHIPTNPPENLTKPDTRGAAVIYTRQHTNPRQAAGLSHGRGGGGYDACQARSTAGGAGGVYEPVYTRPASIVAIWADDMRARRRELCMKIIPKFATFRHFSPPPNPLKALPALGFSAVSTNGGGELVLRYYLRIL